MLKNQIKEFYRRVLNDVNFQNALAAFLKEIGIAKATPEVTALVIKEVILPYSRNLGYNFSLKDLLEFETTEKVMVKVPVEEQVAISGGNAWSTLRRVGNNIYNRLPRKATVFKAMGVAGALIGAAAGAYGLYNYYGKSADPNLKCNADAPMCETDRGDDFWKYSNSTRVRYPMSDAYGPDAALASHIYHRTGIVL